MKKVEMEGAIILRLEIKFWLLCLCIIIYPIFLYTQITFNRTYGGSDNDYSQCVQQTSDGGYIILGYTFSPPAIGLDVYVIKTDSLGNVLWSRTFHNRNFDLGYFIQQTADGGYIVVGETYYDYASGAGWDIYVIKLSSSGDVIWENTYGGDDYDGAYHIQQIEQGNYVIVGSTSSFGKGGKDIIIIKIDSLGNIIMEKTYGGIHDDYGQSVQKTKDGGYIISGSTSSFGSGFSDFYLVKTDSIGNVMWSKAYGGIGEDFCEFAQQTSDGGYVIIGSTWSFGSGMDDIYLVKTDSLGNILFTKSYGGTGWDEGFSIAQTRDNGYIIAGETKVLSGSSAEDFYLIKTNSLGDTLWTKTYAFDASSNDFGRFGCTTLDGGYVITGWTGLFNSDIYLVKTDSQGNLGAVGIEEFPIKRPTHLQLFQNYPNPFNLITIINYQIQIESWVTLKIYNILGQEVKTLVDEEKKPGRYEVRFDSSKLSSGLYIYQLKAGEFTNSKKLLLLK